MAELKLRPWHFNENEIVELYWLGAPYKESPGQWMIPVVFRRPEGSFKEEIFPWGTLPVLIPGRKYIDGTLQPDNSTGTEFTIRISPFTDFSICRGFDIPRSLYSFGEINRYGEQLLCKFMLSGTVYYIPCLEIVRFFLAPHSALLNRLLEPNGMSSLIGQDTELDNGIEIKLTKE